MSINPFQSVLFSTFVKERDLAIQMANDGGVSQGEQLVWVLYKILKGDGSDVRPLLHLAFKAAQSSRLSLVRSHRRPLRVRPYHRS